MNIYIQESASQTGRTKTWIGLMPLNGQSQLVIIEKFILTLSGNPKRQFRNLDSDKSVYNP